MKIKISVRIRINELILIKMEQKFKQLLENKNFLICETPSGLTVKCIQDPKGVLWFYVVNDCIVRYDDIESNQLNKLYELFKKQNIDE